MELSDLNIFQTVALSGGITSAAAQLNRVPSNVTARIQKLELELNQQLFIRDKNRLRISPAGEQLLVYSQKILALAEAAMEDLNNREPHGTLRIGSMEAVAASRLSTVLMDFHEAFTQVDIQVKTNPTGTLINHTLSGDLDLALVADPIADSRLEIVPIYKERLVLISHKAHNTITSARDLGPKPTLIGFNTECAYRSRLSDWAKQAELHAKVIEINSYHALLNCVTAGMGVGLVPAILLAQYPFKEGLRTHPFPAALQHTLTCAIWRKDNNKASIPAFIQTLQKSNKVR